uniref:Uncharacterized protein n=1 Tax=Macrostomum lignano TaxID=282301 RepID=A0A1I8F7S8_9PLAT
MRSDSQKLPRLTKLA